MLGTIFGDLAACTFKQNRLLFNTDLVGEDAFLSDKGLLAMATADALLVKSVKNLSELKSVIKYYHDNRDKNRVHFAKWFEKWCQPESADFSYDSDGDMALPVCCIAAQIDNNLSITLHHRMLTGKASGYAARYFSSLIHHLQKGMSKHEAIHHDGVFMLAQWMKEDFLGEEPYNALHSLILACKAFSDSYDFTSTIKKAAAISEYDDTRVVTMLAAAMAETYYKIDVGCLKFPKSILGNYKDVLQNLKNLETDDNLRQQLFSGILLKRF